MRLPLTEFQCQFVSRQPVILMRLITVRFSDNANSADASQEYHGNRDNVLPTEERDHVQFADIRSIFSSLRTINKINSRCK